MMHYQRLNTRKEFSNSPSFLLRPVCRHNRRTLSDAVTLNQSGTSTQSFNFVKKIGRGLLRSGKKQPQGFKLSVLAGTQYRPQESRRTRQQRHAPAFAAARNPAAFIRIGMIGCLKPGYSRKDRCHGKPKRMKGRQKSIHDIVSAKSHHLYCTINIGENISMTQRHSFGRRLRTTGKKHQCRVLCLLLLQLKALHQTSRTAARQSRRGQTFDKTCFTNQILEEYKLLFQKIKIGRNTI